MKTPGVPRVSVLDPARRYRAELVRLICGEAGPDGPGLKEEPILGDLTGEPEGGEQPVPIADAPRDPTAFEAYCDRF